MYTCICSKNTYIHTYIKTTEQTTYTHTHTGWAEGMKKSYPGILPLYSHIHTCMHSTEQTTHTGWAESMKKSNPGILPPVSASTLQDKALELSQTMGLPDFKASNSWLANFVKRYGLDT